MQNLSFKNDFDLHENESLCGTHFHMNGFARRLVLAKVNSKLTYWSKIRVKFACANCDFTPNKVVVTEI